MVHNLLLTILINYVIMLIEISIKKRRKEIMKKGSKVALALVMCLTMGLTILGTSFVAFADSAQAAITFAVPSVTGTVGSTVDVPITVSANSGIGSADLVLKYDSTKLSLVVTNDSHGNQTEPATLAGGVVGQPNDGEIDVAYANMSGLWDAGTILDAQFTILSTDAVGDSSPLTFTVADMTDSNGTDITGSVTAIPAATLTVVAAATSSVASSSTAATSSVVATTSSKAATSTVAATSSKTAVPNTSDSNNIYFIMLMVLASAAFVVVFRFKKRTV